MKVDYNILQIANNNAEKIEQKRILENKRNREIEIEQEMQEKAVSVFIKICLGFIGILFLVDALFGLINLIIG